METTPFFFLSKNLLNAYCVLDIKNILKVLITEFVLVKEDFPLAELIHKPRISPMGQSQLKCPVMGHFWVPAMGL
jgi:hypothetical protein